MERGAALGPFIVAVGEDGTLTGLLGAEKVAFVEEKRELLKAEGRRPKI